MDVELREALNTGFGPEPAHRPLVDRLEAGHRAVRRRRLAGAMVAVAMAGVVGLGAVAVLGDGGDAPSQVATDAADGWRDGELARYDEDGQLEVRPGVTVLDRIDAPIPTVTGVQQSAALAVEHEGIRSWLLLKWSDWEDGKIHESVTASRPAGPDESFDEWVSDQVRILTTPTAEDDSAGYVGFADDGSLVTTHGIEILEQRHPVDLEDFTRAGEASAAALLRGPDDKKWYVLVRYAEEPDTIAVPFQTGGPTLDDFLAYAREKYASGEGLR